MDWPEVLVKEEWVKEARALGKELGYTSMEVGKTGELAAIDYFRSQGVQLRVDHPVGRPDHFDILAKGSLIEVKTTTKQEIKVPKDTFDRGRRFWVYIGVKLSLPQKKAWICGYVKKEEVPKARARRIGQKEYYCIPLKELRPVQELLPYLRGE